ncbi:MAG: hypothetical protein JWM95_752 [Gemmatimonadetes bacterium]|nr:hypothetical protein [Gemmatimonadota bacterium]
MRRACWCLLLLGCQVAPTAPVETTDAIPHGGCVLRYVQTFRYPDGTRVNVGSALTESRCSAPADVVTWTVTVDGESITYEVRR